MTEESWAEWDKAVDVAGAVTPRNATIEGGRPRAQDHWVNRLPILETIAEFDGLERLPPAFLQARVSGQVGGAVARKQVIDLLGAISEVRSSGEDIEGGLWRSRLTPSAGGTHSVEPVLFIGNDWIVRRGSALCAVSIDEKFSQGLLEDAEEAVRSKFSSVVFAISDSRLIRRRYEDGLSLMWRDAGAFLATTQYAASAIGLASCIAGIARRLPPDGNEFGVYAVGAVVVG